MTAIRLTAAPEITLSRLDTALLLPLPEAHSTARELAYRPLALPYGGRFHVRRPLAAPGDGLAHPAKEPGPASSPESLPRPSGSAPCRVVLTERVSALADDRHWTHEAVLWLDHQANTDLAVMLPEGARLPERGGRWGGRHPVPARRRPPGGAAARCGRGLPSASPLGLCPRRGAARPAAPPAAPPARDGGRTGDLDCPRPRRVRGFLRAGRGTCNASGAGGPGPGSSPGAISTQRIAGPGRDASRLPGPDSTTFVSTVPLR